MTTLIETSGVVKEMEFFGTNMFGYSMVEVQGVPREYGIHAGFRRTHQKQQQTSYQLLSKSLRYL